jgi:thymidylate synthase
MNSKKQKIIVFQQNNSGESKIHGIRKYGKRLFNIQSISIDTLLPPVIDNAEEYLPSDIDADIVLDFFRHPDLSYDLAIMCGKKNIPVIASGKKLRIKGMLTPPT